MSVLKRAGIARKIRFFTICAAPPIFAHDDQRVTERYVRRANDVLAIAARL